MIKRRFAILALTTALNLGCGDAPPPTQPRQPPAAVTPTPTPPPRTSGISVNAVRSRLDPPAGAKHAVLATLVVRETAGRTVQLGRFHAYNYVGTANIAVSGFTPVELGPGQSTTYTLTLTSANDIPCADELWLIVSYDNGAQSGGLGPVLDCSTGEWLF